MEFEKKHKIANLGTPHLDIEFNGELREYQINIVNKYISFVKDSGGGLLDVDPGKGKTVMGLYIISKLKKKIYAKIPNTK